MRCIRLTIIAVLKVCKQLNDDWIQRWCKWLKMSFNEHSSTVTDKVISEMKRNLFHYQLYIIFWMLERNHLKTHDDILEMNMRYNKIQIILIIMNSAI